MSSTWCTADTQGATVLSPNLSPWAHLALILLSQCASGAWPEIDRWWNWMGGRFMKGGGSLCLELTRGEFAMADWVVLGGPIIMNETNNTFVLSSACGSEGLCPCGEANRRIVEVDEVAAPLRTKFSTCTNEVNYRIGSTIWPLKVAFTNETFTLLWHGNVLEPLTLFCWQHVGTMPFVEFIAGWISGAIGLAVGHPMDTIKVRLQTQSIYKGIFHCVMQTYRHEGFHGFLKGMSFPVLSVAVSNSVVFGSYSNALNYLTQSQHKERNPDKKASLWSIYIAGCFSGLMQVLITAPIDLVKVRLQSQHTSHLERDGAKYRGPMHCVAVIFKEDGVRGLFRGMWALTLRDVPCFGLYFLPYELTCRMLTEKGKQPSMHVILVAGGIAGVVTWACATPMDVVKARLQMSGAGGRLYKGTLHCITASLQEEGIWVFFKGLLLNSLRAFPVNAVTFLSYEMLIRAMTASSTGCAQD